MAIGPILKKARLSKQLTESQVAELTRMKVQIVQDLENDDFHRIAATIYGKGFIKLYAKCVGLDPVPLIADYVRSVTETKPSLITDGVDHPSTPTPQTPTETTSQQTSASPAPATEVEPEPETDDLFVYTKKKNTIVDDSVKEAPAPPPPKVETPAITDKAKEVFNKTKSTLQSKSEKITNSMADIQWGDAPIKIIGGIIGLVILILILTISIKSCSHDKPPVSDQEKESLQTPVPPPEPYFD